MFYPLVALLESPSAGPMTGALLAADGGPQPAAGQRGCKGTCPAGCAAACGRVLAGRRSVVPAALRVSGRVAAVSGLPGRVAVLGDDADGRLRRLRPHASGHLAGVRVAV